MKYIKFLFIIVLLTFTANADWKPLKSLDHYGPKAFTLKKGVAYVEIRKYTEIFHRIEPGKNKTTEKNVVFKMYRYPLAHFGSVVSRTFQNIPGNKKFAFKKGGEGGLGNVSNWFHNGFMLDDTHKSWRLENIQDVIDMVQPIDTEAEIRLVLWLNGNADGNVDEYSATYRKDGSGYVVKEHYVSNGDDVYGCGDFTYRYKISSTGKITQKKLLKKRKVACGAD